MMMMMILSEERDEDLVNTNTSHPDIDSVKLFSTISKVSMRVLKRSETGTSHSRLDKVSSVPQCVIK